MLYRYVDGAVVRATAWSDEYQGVPWPELLDPHSATASWQTWLEQVWQIPGFATAVATASPDLAAQVGRICAGPSMPQPTVRRAVLAVLRYLLRARTRATPFGLFAGVEAARISAAPSLRAGNAHRTTTRTDAAWITSLIEHLEAGGELRSHLVLLANDLASEHDGHLGLEHRPHGASDGAPVQVQIRATAPVRAALDSARTPVRWTDLTEKLSADFPTAPRDVIDNLLAGLVQQRFLLTNLRPAMTAPDPLPALVRRTEQAGAAEVAAGLREIAAALTRHDAATDNPAAADAERARATAAMTRLLPAAKPMLALDLRLDWDLVIPEAVAVEAESAAAALTRLAVRPVLSPGWAAWHGRFLERYGPTAVVPVLDAVAMLGYPSGYLGSTATPAEEAVTDRDRRLLKLAHTAVMRRRLEVQLDDASVAELCVVDAHRPVQPSTEVTVRVHSASVASLKEGDFTLHVTGVARAAGATTGRFLHLFDPEDRRRMTDLYAGIPGVYRGALLAQISTTPLYVRAENVARAPRAAELMISLSEYRDPDAGLVPVSDLAVTADAERLHLVSLSRRRPVHTMLLNAVDLTRHTHPLARFLFEAPVALAAPCAGFSWGAASALPFLPALRYGRTVLSPARWILDADQMPGTTASWPQWEQALTSWRRDALLPERVYLGDGDQCVSLNLTEPSHRALLRTHLERHGKALLRTAPTPTDLGWTGGRAHEVVIPMAATGQAVAPVRWPGYAVSREDGHLPGCDSRLYLKLYGNPDRQNPLLVRHLPSLLNELGATRWWFVRYRNPDEHLRVRLSFPPGALGSAVEQVGAWTRRLRHDGLITHAGWDTYYPETARFGGAAAMDAAEDYFTADSAAAQAQLAAQAGKGAHDVRAVTAASLVDIAVGLIGGADEAMHWLIERTRTAETAPPRTVYDQAVALVNPTTGTRLDPRVTVSWAARRTALAAYRTALERSGTLRPPDVLADLLHLHHVRMSGPGLPEERAHLHLARAAALSWTARQKRTS
ncbi:lantibiotic dehydratase [Actinacidiphila acididurans]|uniref:lantibiotic dehydratase n=1 Tax=Actinacidiphila acididurans TaxID=2784346 RepID=UPI0027DBEDD1|nr:lantibiotic dehydratase [Actinacidiphila acididurans]